MKNLTVNTLKELGIETVAKFAGSISVNYLCYMNGGLQGYTYKQMDSIKAKETARVKENFNSYIKGVVDRVNAEPLTTTEKYLKKAYIEWYSN